MLNIFFKSYNFSISIVLHWIRFKLLWYLHLCFIPYQFILNYRICQYRKSLKKFFVSSNWSNIQALYIFSFNSSSSAGFTFFIKNLYRIFSSRRFLKTLALIINGAMFKASIAIPSLLLKFLDFRNISNCLIDASTRSRKHGWSYSNAMFKSIGKMLGSSLWIKFMTSILCLK